jgi:hypothetical protein
MLKISNGEGHCVTADVATSGLLGVSIEAMVIAARQRGDIRGPHITSSI